MMDLKCSYQDLDSVCICWVVSPPFHLSTMSRVLEASLQAGHVNQLPLTSGQVETLPTSIHVGCYRTACLFGLLLCVQESRFNTQFLEFFYEISALVHLQENVATTHKFPIEKHLWNRGPVGECFHAC